MRNLHMLLILTAIIDVHYEKDGTTILSHHAKNSVMSAANDDRANDSPIAKDQLKVPFAKSSKRTYVDTLLLKPQQQYNYYHSKLCSRV